MGEGPSGSVRSANPGFPPITEGDPPQNGRSPGESTSQVRFTPNVDGWVGPSKFSIVWRTYSANQHSHNENLLAMVTSRYI